MKRMIKGVKQITGGLALLALLLGSPSIGQASDMNDGAKISLEGMDLSATFVRFDHADNDGADLTDLLAEVEQVLHQDGVAQISADDLKELVVEAQTMLAPVLAATGGGTMPDLTALSLDDWPTGLPSYEAQSGPIALPGLGGLDNALSGSLVTGSANGLDGTLGSVTGALPTLPVVHGILGQ